MVDENANLSGVLDELFEFVIGNPVKIGIGGAVLLLLASTERFRATRAKPVFNTIGAVMVGAAAVGLATR